MNSFWIKYFMDIAVRTAEQSHCKRLQVGAVAVRDKRIILTGLNGTPPGEDNCCEDRVERISSGSFFDTVTKDSVSHAEENLVTFAALHGISLKGCGLFVTHSPCIQCAKLIKNSGIDYVVYRDVFRSSAGLEYLYERKVNAYLYSELILGK